MEPGHPPRQDPPTEHSHDQVNGSPPRPGSRRGWMSDSPLDGGSGWPTSAYALVPRQPAAPRKEREEPKPEPVAALPVPSHAAPQSRTGRVIALVVGLIVLIVAIVGGVLATRHSSGDQPVPRAGQPQGITTPTLPPGAAPGLTGSAGATTSIDANGSPVVGASGPDPGLSPDPGAVVISPLPEGSPTDVLRAGTVRLAYLVGRPDDAFDLDTGVKQAAGADMAAAATGIKAVNGAQLAPWTGLSNPTQADCSSVVQWTDQVLLTALIPGARVCVRTSGQRFAWFTPRGGDALVSGAIYTTYLDFTVWKKPGE